MQQVISNIKPYEAILFDLDGTLIDSAHDLATTANLLLARYNRTKKTLENLRQYVTYGAKKLVEVAFDNDYPEPFEILRQDFLTIYETICTDNLIYFQGIKVLLNNIEQANIPWGIVTNKSTFLTEIITNKLRLNQRAGAVVCGDTLPVSKPDPSPILLACNMIGANPKECIYIGDSKNDITAGTLADMPTIACGYGYIHNNDNPSLWGATYVAHHSVELFSLLSK